MPYSRFTNFNAHWAINVRKCFTLVPKVNIDLRHCQIPTNHLKAVSDLARQITDWTIDKKKFFADKLEFHIGKKSTYKKKVLLNEKVKIIYARLTNQLDESLGAINQSDKVLILEKMEEDISECTPGFHNRVMFILASMSLPRSLDELIMFVREELVQKVATQNNEIHNNSYYYTIAKENGLGVEEINSDDPYATRDQKDLIRKKLAENFEYYYTPFYIANKIIELLKSKLFSIGYIGERFDQGYVLSEFEKQIEYFNQLLGVNYKHEYLQLNDEGGVKDLSWTFIKKILWQKLLDDKFFDFENLSEGLKYFTTQGESVSGNLTELDALNYADVFATSHDLIESLKLFDDLSQEQYISWFGAWLARIHSKNNRKTYAKLFKFMAEEEHKALNVFLSFLAFNDESSLDKCLCELTVRSESFMWQLVKQKKWKSLAELINFSAEREKAKWLKFLFQDVSDGRSLLYQIIKSNTKLGGQLIEKIKGEREDSLRSMLSLNDSENSLVNAALLHLNDLLLSRKKKSYFSREEMIRSSEFQEIAKAKGNASKIVAMAWELNPLMRENVFISGKNNNHSGLSLAISCYPHLASQLFNKLKAIPQKRKKKILKEEGSEYFLKASRHCPKLLPELLEELNFLSREELEEVLISTNNTSHSNSLLSLAMWSPQHLELYLSMVKRLSKGGVEVLLNSETTDNETALSALLKSNAPYSQPLIDLLGSLEDEALESLLKHQISDGKNSLMLSIETCPQYFEALHEFVLSFNNVDHFFIQLTKNNESLLNSLARLKSCKEKDLCYRSLEKIKEKSLQQLFLLVEKNGDKTALMEAIKFSNENASELLRLLSTLSFNLQVEVLAKQNSQGWNALIYALKTRSQFSHQLLEKLEEITEQQPNEAFHILNQQTGNGTSALMIALRNKEEPEFAEKLLGVIGKLPPSMQQELLLPRLYDGESALTLALKHNSAYLNVILPTLNGVSQEELLIFLNAKKLELNPLVIAARSDSREHLIPVFRLYCQGVGVFEAINLVPIIIENLSEAEKKECLSVFLECYQREKRAQGLSFSPHTVFGFDFGYANEEKMCVASKVSCALKEAGFSKAVELLKGNKQVTYCATLSQIIANFALEEEDPQQKRRRLML